MKPQQLTVAEKAKSVLLERGWRQGPRARARTSVCLVDALVAAVKAPGLETHELYYVLAEALRHIGFEGTFEAFQWNDATGRTFEQVLERLDTWA